VGRDRSAGPPPDFEAVQPAARPTRWTGFLTPAATGTYRLGVEGFGNRLFLDDKKLVDQTGGFPPPPSVVDVALEKGRRYAIRIESIPRRWAATRLVWMPPRPDAEARAVAAAREADVVVAVVGITSELEGEESGVHQEGFQGGDRTSLDLPRVQQELMEKVVAVAAGKPVVLVVLNGSALALNWADENVPAIVEAWYPGQAAGTAVADVLFGIASPAGRLPITFYRSIDQLPAFDDYSMKNRTYRFFKGQPLYPFGHGLSYARFKYSKLSVPKKAVAGVPIAVAVQVENEGGMEADEVVQLYVQDLDAAAPLPLRSLKSFQRVMLQPGEKRVVRFTLDDRAFSNVAADGRRVVEPGRFTIAVGGKQPGLTGTADAKTTMVLTASLELTGAPKPLAP